MIFYIIIFLAKYQTSLYEKKITYLPGILQFLFRLIGYKVPPNFCTLQRFSYYRFCLYSQKQYCIEEIL